MYKQKTYAQDFLERFPNAPKRNTGVPHPCRANMYGEKNNGERAVCRHVGSCEQCWNEQMPKPSE